MKASSTVLLSATAIGILMAASAPEAAEDDKKPQTANVFQLPARAALQQRHSVHIARLFRDRRYAEAERELRQLIGRFPDWPMHHYNLAAVLAQQNKSDQALESLATAIDLGLSDRATIERDPVLAPLRSLPRFQELLTKTLGGQRNADGDGRTPGSPALVKSGRAVVDQSNTIWEPRSNTLIARFKFAEAPESRQVRNDTDDVSRLLNRRYDGGDAAGNHGDLYDNRDKGHSALTRESFPQMSHIEYGAEAQAAGVNYGVNSQVLFNAITLGNSSTAVTSGRFWRSQARLVLTTHGLAARAYLHYANDHLYIYPEHRDHDPENGDLFPANTPYMIVSQGSSGSDGPFLGAVGSILAAFRPDVKKFLRDRHLVMPTVQMIVRSGMKSVRTHQDYLSAKAHPSVFDKSDIDLKKMVNRAQRLRAGSIPPRVQIAVIEESRPRPGVDYFGPTSEDEVLFDTPSAIARIARSTSHEQRLVISAAKTIDPNGRPLKFLWKVLRGDSERITISPINDAGSQVELRIPWHRPRPVPFKPQLMTNRVDVAVFVHNGEHYSAPAFVTVYYPPNQIRKYDGAGRLLEIDYGSADAQKPYADPVLFARRTWRDRFAYTEAGDLIGWRRTSGDASHQFTRHGARVVETDADGRPIKAELICYEARSTDQDYLRVFEAPTRKFATYRYRNASDVLGEVSLPAGKRCPGSEN